MSECGHDGWVAGCSRCEENERIALAALGEGDRCELCGGVLASRDHVYSIEGAGNHVDCLEDAGLWNATPETEDL